MGYKLHGQCVCQNIPPLPTLVESPSFLKKCGKGVYLRQGVTVGSNGKPKTRNPILGENIKFGANSIVIGPITIGNNVTIAAGAVVTKDIPDNCVVAGVPAKIIRNL